MAEIIAMIEEAGSALAAAKEIRDGVVTTYEDLSSIVSTIGSTMRKILGTAVYSYDDVAKFSSLASLSWITPNQFARYITNIAALDFSDITSRRQSWAFYEIVAKTHKLHGDQRFPETVLMCPFIEPVLRPYMKLIWSCSMPSVVTPTEFEQYHRAFEDAVTEVLLLLTQPDVSFDRSSFEIAYHLEWVAN